MDDTDKLAIWMAAFIFVAGCVVGFMVGINL